MPPVQPPQPVPPLPHPELPTAPSVPHPQLTPSHLRLLLLPPAQPPTSQLRTAPAQPPPPVARKGFMIPRIQSPSGKVQIPPPHTQQPQQCFSRQIPQPPAQPQQVPSALVQQMWQLPPLHVQTATPMPSKAMMDSYAAQLPQQPPLSASQLLVDLYEPVPPPPRQQQMDAIAGRRVDGQSQGPTLADLVQMSAGASQPWLDLRDAIHAKQFCFPLLQKEVLPSWMVPAPPEPRTSTVRPGANVSIEVFVSRFWYKYHDLKFADCDTLLARAIQCMSVSTVAKMEQNLHTALLTGLCMTKANANYLLLPAPGLEAWQKQMYV